MSTVAARQALALLPLVASPYRVLVARAVERWTKNSGFSWATERCKSVLMWLLKTRAGEAVEPPAWISRKYLAYAEKVTRQASFAKFSQLIQLWRIYTAMMERPPLDLRQVEKFEHAVTAPVPQREGVLQYDSANPRAQVPWTWVSERPVQECLPEVRLPDVVPVRNPLALRLRDPDGSLSKEWEELVVDSYTLQLWAGKWKFTDTWPYALRQIPRINLSTPRKKAFVRPGYVGNVFCRVQRDGKHRFYFAPPDWAQFLMGPWAKELYSALRHIPQDCTFDQERGAEWVMERLKEDKRVFSFDLVSATDRFPLALTREVLMALSPTPNMRMWVDTFSILARIPANARYDGTQLGLAGVQWKVGQPLGAIPSFAAFALTHHAVLRGLYPGDPQTAPYVILGDDLVIADEELATRYRNLMHRLGVEISESKSLQGRLGEFAGRVISSTAWEYKLKYFHVNYRTLLSMISLIGPRALKAMPATRLRNVIALLPTPRTPLGINPGGFPKGKVDKFLVSYFATQREEDVHGELWTDSEAAVRARDELFRAVAPYPRLFSTADAWNPIGSSRVGYGGAPVSGPVKGRNNWSWSPYLSRSWLRRVIRLAREAGLL